MSLIDPIGAKTSPDIPDPRRDPQLAPFGEIACRDVSLWFPARDNHRHLHVLDRVNLRLGSGEFVAVLGPSGCGKTSLLRIIAGLQQATEGSIEVNGKRHSGPNPDVSVVFQNAGLLPWKTVWANVELGLRLKYRRPLTKEERDLVAEYIHMVGLSGFENYYPFQLSGGMQQRVGLARALARRPQILLMDEPFGALDAQNRAIMQEELERLLEQYRATVLFITHDLDEAILLADRVIVMSRLPGKIKEEYRVPLPRPRYAADVRSEAGFLELRRQTWHSIRSELSRERG